ncbi:FtsX-like permease family protein [Flavobacteriaceae bacterium AU392]|nr:ABC transporter permease [Flavobacteriaceae bacterium]RKM81462.1 FtsX-like permease family protein [Flavobacteriaceae bacterium AU392]
MIKTNLKIGFRSILKHKGFLALNAGGLIIGLTAVLLISLWVYSELSFNKSFKNYSDIASVMQHIAEGEEVRTYTGQPMQLAPVLRDAYGNHFKYVATSTRDREYDIDYGEKVLSIRGRFAEPDLALLLDLEMVTGSREALTDMSSILISKSTAENLFGSENPIGKAFDFSPTMKVKVAGIYEDLPSNSSFDDTGFIASFELLKTTQGYEERLGWGNFWFLVYAQLQDGNTLQEVSTLIKDIRNDNYTESTREAKLFLHPMSKWHLYSEFENGVNVGGDITGVTVFGIIGLFILFLACINFMNLSTANALKRGKEVGVRKTLGSSRKQLVFQFFTESFVIIFFSFCIALGFAYILLPQFNVITLKELAIPFSDLSFWGISALLIFITGILSSLYPSIYISGFKPVKVLKGLISGNKSAVAIRKTLIVTQFVISGVLIIATLTVMSQINHAKNRPIGFNKDLLVSMPINTSKVRQSFDLIKREFEESPYIDQVTASDVRITSTTTTNGGFEWRGKDPKLEEEFYTIRATDGFGKMVEWEIIQGRDFSAQFASDSLAFIVNEAAVKYMGFKNPIGEYVKWGKNRNYEIIGVVKDMVGLSPFDPIVPTLYILHQGDFLNYFNIKIASGDNAIQGALAKMESVFQKHNPENLFSYRFMDDDYQRNFDAEKRVAKLIGLFALVAIFISCLGVLGLSTYMAIQRKKEIGIRKVLGASVQAIWQLLSKQFMVLVLISLIIAIPIGYYISTLWLEEYSYRISVNFGIIASSGVIILGIALLTVSVQIIKAAVVNPVKSLRTE